ncbi:Laeverin, partial [Camponotus floridanus]
RWLTDYHTFEIRRLFPILKDTLYSTLHTSYNISIKHHKNYTALSNMDMKAINMDENNMQWTRFKITPAMPVYSIAAGIIHLAFISETNQSTRLWCRTNMISHVQFAYSVIKNITRYLNNKVPNSKKILEVNHVAIPKLLAEGEETKLGIIFYR